MNSLDGTFWVDPETKVPGTFALDEDGTFLLELQGYVFWPEQLDRSNPNYIAQSGDPAKIVADFWPRDILGVLASGEPISLLGALMEQPPLNGSISQQRFKVPSFIRGAHLQGRGGFWLKVYGGDGMYFRGALGGHLVPPPKSLDSWPGSWRMRSRTREQQLRSGSH
ncbi:hypothetical protein FDK12_13360 [Arthrobacter sp. NamB2]|uniref:hypothetical protein n=1 Tax=Arthrobacter sp. NamB2 TaxID=2576035 RepID=UPI0010C979F9|nr:hypothetical protein [Arthrobacter sp. NamB2]TKV26368.1 hypothetical protein FDK12_13360 [Arthrobacter sp. NamB2]